MVVCPFYPGSSLTFLYATATGMHASDLQTVDIEACIYILASYFNVLVWCIILLVILKITKYQHMDKVCPKELILLVGAKSTGFSAVTESGT